MELAELKTIQNYTDDRNNIINVGDRFRTLAGAAPNPTGGTFMIVAIVEFDFDGITFKDHDFNVAVVLAGTHADGTPFCDIQGYPVFEGIWADAGYERIGPTDPDYDVLIDKYNFETLARRLQIAKIQFDNPTSIQVGLLMHADVNPADHEKVSVLLHSQYGDDTPVPASTITRTKIHDAMARTYNLANLAADLHNNNIDVSTADVTDIEVGLDLFCFVNKAHQRELAETMYMAFHTEG
jgi:hypothetical protein